MSSGRFVNFAKRVFARYPCPLGASSIDVTVSPKFAAQLSKNGIPSSLRVVGCKYVCIVYISVMLLDTGVPVRNTTPRSLP